jgi:hypothetical protein
MTQPGCGPWKYIKKLLARRHDNIVLVFERMRWITRYRWHGDFPVTVILEGGYFLDDHTVDVPKC